LLSCQDYDPDLPPELAAAAGHHDISVDNMNHGKMDNGQSDLSGQGRGLPCIRAPFVRNDLIFLHVYYLQNPSSFCHL